MSDVYDPATNPRRTVMHVLYGMHTVAPFTLRRTIR